MFDINKPYTTKSGLKVLLLREVGEFPWIHKGSIRIESGDWKEKSWNAEGVCSDGIEGFNLENVIREVRLFPTKVSTVQKLFDGPTPRMKFETMSKLETMLSDSRNDDAEFWTTHLEDFLQWGKCYRITFEEVSDDEKYNTNNRNF